MIVCARDGDKRSALYGSSDTFCVTYATSQGAVLNVVVV
jgi:hypothetical protein